jgi:hypothetical protein
MPRCLQLLQLLIYQSRHLGNDLGQATDTELPIRNVESFINIGQKLLWMPNQLRTKSLLGSAPKIHPISQSTVSDSLKPIYDYLDTEKKLERPERLIRRDGNWPDLEAALFQWQLAINRQNVNGWTPVSYESQERFMSS